MGTDVTAVMSLVGEAIDHMREGMRGGVVRQGEVMQCSGSIPSVTSRPRTVSLEVSGSGLLCSIQP
ncbi:hypothetical protein J6590_029010 [Homalodisca vitripennis]|nr:hypothetical protein J6590_029010 [Homalodisca vitripennis]